MKKNTFTLCLKSTFSVAMLCAAANSASAQSAVSDTLYVPQRAIVVHGEPSKADKNVMAVFYTRENLAPNDPDAPRFLFLDREGKIAFGIGGQLYATGSYDFHGAIESTGFTTYDIPVPANPAQRSRLGADISHSSIFLKLVGKSNRFGMFQAYFQANFTGNNGGYGFKLKQAYIGVGNFTLGLTNSTFVDPATQANTIDCEGPSGQIGTKNILFRYTTPVRKGFSAAFSVEMPQASYTLSQETESLSARVPDIPAYVQYSWSPGQHLRLSGIFRDLAYRDLKTAKNKLQPGYGVKLSTITNIDRYGIVQLYGHIAYGKGIGQYVNDLGGNGYDLVYTTKAGQLEAPEVMGWTAGVVVNATDKLSFTSSFSRAEVFGLEHLGKDGYHYGQYFDVNGFYSFDANFKIGAEYCRGWRKDYNDEVGTANRLNVLVQYSF